MDFGLFGIGLPQIFLIMMVALIVFGPERLPKIARQAGRWVNDLRRLSEEARSEISSLTKDLELRESLKSVQDDLAEIRKDLSLTGQELAKDIEDIKKEVDLRETTTPPLDIPSVEAESSFPDAPTVALDATDAAIVASDNGALDPDGMYASSPKVNGEMNGELSGDMLAQTTDEYVPDETRLRQALIQDVVDSSYGLPTENNEAPTSFKIPSLDEIGNNLLQSQAAEANGDHELRQKVEALEEMVANNRSDLNQRLASLESYLAQRIDRLEELLAEPTRPGQN